MRRGTKKNKSKRLVILSDGHAGHLTGLTPPGFGIVQPGTQEGWRYKAYNVAHEVYGWFEAEISALKAEKPIDICVNNGDAIDGRGERSGSTELIATDRHTQAKMAAGALLLTEAPVYVATYGTPYHTGEKEDFEDVMITELRNHPSVKRAKIGSHEWIDVNGCVFDFKHKVGSSTIPHGRFTAPAKEQLWNVLWAEHDEQPKADVIVRSHVHYHTFCGTPTWMALTTPALQGMGTKYGSRQCTGRVDIGFIHFDIEPDGSYTWQAHIAKLACNKAKALKL